MRYLQYVHNLCIKTLCSSLIPSRENMQLFTYILTLAMTLLLYRQMYLVTIINSYILFYNYSKLIDCLMQKKALSCWCWVMTQPSPALSAFIAFKFYVIYYMRCTKCVLCVKLTLMERGNKKKTQSIMKQRRKQQQHHPQCDFIVSFKPPFSLIPLSKLLSILKWQY